MPVSADVAWDEIERVKNLHGGYFQPKHLVDESRREEAPLHPAFEWDDSVAAEEYRVHQARYMARNIIERPVGDPDAPPIRPLVSIVKEDEEGRPSHFYVGTSFALSDPEYRRQVLANAMRDAQTFKDKWAHLDVLAGVIAEINRVQEHVRRTVAQGEETKESSDVRRAAPPARGKKLKTRGYIPRGEVEKARRGRKRGGGRSIAH